MTHAAANALPMPLLAGMASGVVSRVAAAGLSFVAALVLARALGVDAYGVYALALSLVAILSRVATMGLPELILRETAAGRGEGPAAVRDLLRFGLVVALTVSGIVCCGLLLAAASDGLVPEGWTRQTAWAVCAMVPLGAVAACLLGALNGLGRVQETIWLGETLRLAIFLALIALAVGVAGVTLTPALGLALSAAATALLVAILAARLGPGMAPAPRARPDAAARRDWLRAALVLGAVGLASAGYQQADILMLGWLAGAEEVGLYHAANRLSNLLVFFATAAAIPLAPIIAAHHAAGRVRPAAQATVRAAGLVVCAVAVPAAMLVAMPMQVLSLLFGPDFAGADRTLQILALFRVPGAVAVILVLALKMIGAEQRLLLPVIVCLAVNVGGNLVLIPAAGIEGAALATGVSWAVLAALAGEMLRRRLSRQRSTA